jgi:hypothetical protein
MSNNVNEELLERASECIDYFGGTTIGKILESDLDSNDLTALVTHVAIAEAQMSQAEFEASDIA